MFSRREAIKKLLGILCGSLTLPSLRIAKADQPISWGSLVCMVGPFPAQHILTGVNMAIDEINAQGGLLGRAVKHTIHEAADSTPSTIIKMAESMLNTVNFLGGGFLSPASSAAIDRLSYEKKVIFCEYTGRLFPYQSDYPNYFSVGITPFQMGKSLSRAIFEIYGKEPKTYAVFGEDIYSARQISAGIEWTSKELGLEKLREDFLPLKAGAGYTAEIVLLKQIKPSFLFAPIFNINMMKAFASQCTEFGLKKSVKVIFPFSDILLVKTIGMENIAGIYVGLPWYWKSEFPGVNKFVSDFLKRTNSVPSYYAADAYTIVHLILDVAKEIKSLESNKLIGALENRTFRYLKGEEKIRKEDHLTLGQILLAIGKAPSEIKEEDDFFRIIKVAMADCIVDAC